jgi:hypothetical protein
MTSTTPPPPDPEGADRPQPGSMPDYPAYPTYPTHPAAGAEGGGAAGGMPTYPQGGQPAAPEVPPPPSIKTAVMLMRVGAGLSLLGVLVGLLTLGSLKDNIRQTLIDNNTNYTESDLDTAYNIAVGSVIVLGLLGAGIWLWMAYANGKGQKWARIVATVLGVLNVIFTAVSLAQQQQPLGSEVLTIIVALLAIAIVVFLWRKESSDFYAARSRPKYT